ncbi:SRPBCC family protein [Phenylobacterium sp.]|uniref:SRPBCC family protein n=1 Tax=Phenylobacterium sp. TaxID=1871053 RepID=UPI002811D593|nr:SRPBCC family protein [Phenylobacterium sp.]
MATLIKTIEIDAPADAVWDAVADFGAVHRRFAPGFVTDVKLVPGGRMVTFGEGLEVFEAFLGLDQQARRLAYSVRIEQFEHHSASFQVSDIGGGRSRLTWTVDVLPDSAAELLEPRLDAGLAAARTTLGRVPA